MDIEKLGAEYGGKICFRGGIDRQEVLPHGTVRDVERHVKHIMDSFAIHKGGYIACGEIGSDVPLANVEAMYETFTCYGTR